MFKWRNQIYGYILKMFLGAFTQLFSFLYIQFFLRFLWLLLLSQVLWFLIFKIHIETLHGIMIVIKQFFWGGKVDELWDWVLSFLKNLVIQSNLFFNLSKVKITRVPRTFPFTINSYISLKSTPNIHLLIMHVFPLCLLLSGSFSSTIP